MEMTGKIHQMRTALWSLDPTGKGRIALERFEEAVKSLSDQIDTRTLEAMLIDSGALRDESKVDVDAFLHYLFDGACTDATEDAAEVESTGVVSVPLPSVSGRVSSSRSREAKPDFRLRAVTIGDILKFFVEDCGNVYFEDTSEDRPKPVCKPFKLASKVAKYNMQKAPKDIALRTDLYAVNQLLIRPYTAEEKVSMSEKWHPGGLMVRYFISHYWGEDFGEFVQSLYRFALMEVKDPSLTIDDLKEKAFGLQLYICAFSNNQHRLNDELAFATAEGLKSTPFYVALAAPTTLKVVLNLDHQVSALQRAWCAFEFALTCSAEKEFFLNTYLGPVSKLPIERDEEIHWLEHMSEMLDIVDLEKAQATRKQDKDMIMARLQEEGVDKLHHTLKSRISTVVLPLLAAAGKQEQVRKALKNGANVNARDGQRLTALTYAAGYEHDAVVQMLLEARADADTQEKAVELVQMFGKESRRKRLDAMGKVRKYITEREPDEPGKKKKFHAQALSLAERLDLEMEAVVQSQYVRSPDSFVKAEALGRLAGTGRAALPHVGSIVAALDGDDTHQSAAVRASAMVALHSLGRAAARLAMPHLMAYLGPDSTGYLGASPDTIETVLEVLENFTTSLPREYDGILMSAIDMLEDAHQARRVVLACDHLHIAGRFSTPSVLSLWPRSASHRVGRQRPLSGPLLRPHSARLRSFSNSRTDSYLNGNGTSEFSQLAEGAVEHLIVSELDADRTQLDMLRLGLPTAVKHLGLDFRYSGHLGKVSRAFLGPLVSKALEVTSHTLILDLHFCDAVKVDLLHRTFQAEAVQRLSALHVFAGGVIGLEDTSLNGLAAALPASSQLASFVLDLGIRGYKKFTKKGVSTFSETLRDKIETWKSLTTFSLCLGTGANNIPLKSFGRFLDADDLQSLRSLKLALPASSGINDNGLDLFPTLDCDEEECLTMLSMPPGLEELVLDFTASREVTDTGMKALLEVLAECNLDKLSSLGLNLRAAPRISNASLEALAALAEVCRLTSLRLDVASADIMDGGGFQQLLERLGPGLEVLWIDVRQSAKLTDVSLAALGRTISQARDSLTCLSLTFGANENLSNKGLATLFPDISEGLHAKLQSLHLDLSQCSAIGDKGIQSLSAAFPANLECLELNLSYNRKLTEAALISVGKQLETMKKLKRLSLDFMAAELVKDSGVEVLAAGLKGLRELQIFCLNLHYAKNLTDKVLRALARALCHDNMPHLESVCIDLFHSLKLTTLGVRELRENLETLQELTHLTVHVATETKHNIRGLMEAENSVKMKLIVHSSNLAYTAPEEMKNLSHEIVTALLSTELAELDVKNILRRNSVRQARRKPLSGEDPRLMLFFTDLVPDDSMAMAQLRELRFEAKQPHAEPVIVFCADFAQGKDEERIFELKLLTMALMLGITNVFILGMPPDNRRSQGGNPKRAEEVARLRGETLERLADKIMQFEGNRIDMYIMAPPRGNLAAVVETLRERGCFEECTLQPEEVTARRLSALSSISPLGESKKIIEEVGVDGQQLGVKHHDFQWNAKKIWRVTMTTSVHNVRGLDEGDRKALGEIMRHTEGEPLVDISKYVFFGADNSHPSTESFNTFAPESFATRLQSLHPLLVGTLRLYHELQNRLAVRPTAAKLLDKKHRNLSLEELEVFDHLRSLYDNNQYEEYAKQLHSHQELFDKVKEKKRSALHAVALGGAESPLLNQLVFLYEWVRTEDRHAEVFATRSLKPGAWVQLECRHGMAACTNIRPSAPSGTELQAIQPHLKAPRAEDSLLSMRSALQNYLFKALTALDDPLDFSQFTLTGPGNLCYSTPKEVTDKALDMINRCWTLPTHDTLRWLLQDSGQSCEPPPGGDNDSRLMVVLTDLEPDDTMAIAQLWRWKVEALKMRRPPLVIFLADFADKDRGTVFEKKVLVAGLMLGAVPFHVLAAGIPAASDQDANPKFGRWLRARQRVFGEIAAELAEFSGKQIDLYICAPLRGCLAGIVAELTRQGHWPLKATWQVRVYSGAFNLKGFYEDDWATLRTLVMEMSEDRPLVDLSKYPFFGGRDSPRVAASLTSFAKEGFAAAVSTHFPLLAAALKLLNDEHNWSLVNPHQDKLWRDLPASLYSHLPELEQQYKDARTPDELARFAMRIFGDEELFTHVKDIKRSTLQAFAYSGCDSPLCDQLLFLYEWLLETHLPLLSKTEPAGRWMKEKNYTIVKEVKADYEWGPTDIRAIQPVLRYPHFKQGLEMMRGALNDYLMRHLHALKDHSAEGGKRQAAAPPQALARRKTCG